MLMIDGIELVVADQLQQVREFDRNAPTGSESELETLHKVLDVGNVSKHIVCRYQVRRFSGCGEFRALLLSKKCNVRGDSLFHGHPGDVGRRFNAEDGNAKLLEILEQIAVVAGDFHDSRCSTQLQSFDHILCIFLAMPEPTVGIRGEIRVDRKYLLWGFKLG